MSQKKPGSGSKRTVKGSPDVDALINKYINFKDTMPTSELKEIRARLVEHDPDIASQTHTPSTRRFHNLPSNATEASLSPPTYRNVQARLRSGRDDEEFSRFLKGDHRPASRSSMPPRLGRSPSVASVRPLLENPTIARVQSIAERRESYAEDKNEDEDKEEEEEDFEGDDDDDDDDDDTDSIKELQKQWNATSEAHEATLREYSEYMDKAFQADHIGSLLRNRLADITFKYNTKRDERQRESAMREQAQAQAEAEVEAQSDRRRISSTQVSNVGPREERSGGGESGYKKTRRVKGKEKANK